MGCLVFKFRLRELCLQCAHTWIFCWLVLWSFCKIMIDEVLCFGLESGYAGGTLLWCSCCWTSLHQKRIALVLWPLVDYHNRLLITKHNEANEPPKYFGICKLQSSWTNTPIPSWNGKFKTSTTSFRNWIFSFRISLDVVTSWSIFINRS